MKIKKKIKIISLVVVILIAIIVFFLIENKTTDIQDVKLTYKEYSIPNESFLKQNCAAIRVGRCDILGGKIGDDCWNQKINLFYDIEGVSYKNLICDVSDRDKLLGKFSFQPEGDSKFLTIKTDVRTSNDITVCCSLQGSAEQICLKPVRFEAIC